MKNLKKLRTKAGISQQALANRFNLSQQAIYKYENGISEPDIETLKGMARFFQVTVDELIGNTDFCVREDSSYSASFTSDEVAMIHEVRDLNPNVREAVRQFISSLSTKSNT